MTVNASNNVTKSADVLTIGAIAEGEITVGNATWNGTNSCYEIPVNYSNGVSPSAITTVTATMGTVAFAKLADGTTNDTTKIVLTGIPQKLWTSQDVGITISDGCTHTIQNAAVLNIQAYVASDFTITGPDQCTSSGEYTISMNNGLDMPTIESSDVTVEGTGASVAWASPKATVTVTQGWDVNPVTLKIKGNLLTKTITVPAKAVEIGNIHLSVTTPADSKWVNTLTSVTFTITVDTGLTLSSVTSADSTVTLTNNNGTYELKTSGEAKIPESIAVNVKTDKNPDSAISVRVFPESSNPNRFFGRTISGNSLQDVYTFGDSPKTAGALQSHVVEVPKFIQKFWQNDETAADEVTSTVTKEAKKAEKKSSKKTSKKAAKKAVEAVTETAAALEVTELPVEALEETKTDDQLAMILPKTANTEEAEVVEPQASVSTGSVDVSVTEAEPASHSSAVIWVILAVFCTAIAGLVLCLKKKRA